MRRKLVTLEVWDDDGALSIEASGALVGKHPRQRPLRGRQPFYAVRARVPEDEVPYGNLRLRGALMAAARTLAEEVARLERHGSIER